ncbi:hypothetical protein IAR55_003045 [Kwoniella newhampshirensis]|uniref:Integral membrane protein n=1 Tax=Kwoniella newhampshirensis TaxID=1651941 RepID=A0AAW0YY55_9TREE
MSASSDTNMLTVAILGGTTLTFTAHHTYRFDRWRCLVPRKKEWFRVLLTWMLLGSTMGMFVWAAGWCYVKYELGWITLPGYGPIPVPPEMFAQKYVHLNIPLTIVFSIGFSLQSSLNAEEGLYWYSLMRAVRRPKLGRAWLKSSFFYAWIVISLICTFLQCSLCWIHKGHLDLGHQMAILMMVDGVVEMVVMLSSSIVIWKFPAFLDNVKTSGAGPEVRSRLHFYHEANKVRTFFRFLYAACLMALGADALTTVQRINDTPLANDLLQQIAFGSFFFVLLISTYLYLPRNWSPEKIDRNLIMVGGQARAGGAVHPAIAQAASGVALMSLLREGGQWDGDDDVIGHKSNRNERPFNMYELHKWDDKSSSIKESGWDSERNSGVNNMPSALEHFVSPFDVQTRDNAAPTELRVHVEHEVRLDVALGR